MQTAKSACQVKTFMITVDFAIRHSFPPPWSGNQTGCSDDSLCGVQASAACNPIPQTWIFTPTPIENTVKTKAVLMVTIMKVH